MEETAWPDHFQLTFKAINTVLAFISPKGSWHPLEIAQVSEIKALLPDLVKFSYIPSAELQTNEGHNTSARSVDYSQATLRPSEREGHVLVLDFADNSSSRKSSASSQSLSSVPALSPTAIKKLIESRNERFRQAVQDACPELADDEKLALNSDERPSVNEVIANVSTSIWYKDQIISRRTIQAKEAQTSLLDPPISKNIADAVLTSRNIHSLYSHQVAAIDAIRRGRHVVVSTSTASGKSVIYQVNSIIDLPGRKSHRDRILVFPTKALAQDQKLHSSNSFKCSGLNKLKVATYDGDTSQEARKEIRDTASVILTNFDTLHASILPNEEMWRSFLKRLKVGSFELLYILAVDELHYYTGLLGSATLANPAEYMSKMFALDASEVEVVSNDGAPSGAKDYLIWNPPLVDEMDPSLGRRSSLSEASNLMRFLMKKGFRVILFCKIRKFANCGWSHNFDVGHETIKSDLSNEGRLDILDKVRVIGEDRRKIEHEAFSGQLLGIIATNALELGIDIGALDAVIMLGFPMTISNFKQQAAHLQCAAYEIPLTSDDAKWFGPMTMEICKNKLKRDEDGWHVSIRGAQEDTYVVVEIRKDRTQQAAYMLEEVEVSRALFELYEGGVIDEISHDEKTAKVIREDVNYITSPSRIEPLQTFRTMSVNDHPVEFGRVNVHVKVFGFFKIRGNVILDAVELITPPWEREALGFWIDLPTDILESLQVEEIDSAAAIHATEHAFLNQFALSQDVKTDCRVAKEEDKDDNSPGKRFPRLIFYDAAGKTGGIVGRAFDHGVQSIMCKDANLISSKIGANIILNGLLGGQLSLQNVESK
ncbi:DEAD/H helicase [Pholiota molesta]|nr:DEAD/H helicase [Pholiota molesta]